MAEIKKRTNKKLWVEIPEDLYNQLQINAKKRNITFTRVVTRALVRYIVEEFKYE